MDEGVRDVIKNLCFLFDRLVEEYLPGGVACGTDSDGLQDSTRSQLLHCSLGIKSDMERQEKVVTQTVIDINTKDILFFLQKGLFEVIGLYAADIMWGGAVQGVHQKVQGLTKLDTQRQNM